jgi:uncharacterized lipoprotein YmbA
MLRFRNKENKENLIKGGPMKILKKLMVIVLIISLLTLAACGGRKQPVTKSQYDVARQETLDAEARVAALRAEHSRLEAEYAAKNAKLLVLQEMEREGQ